MLINDRSYDAKALAAVNDPAAPVADIARRMVKDWNLEQRAPAGPKIETLKPEQVVADILRQPGEASRGEALFARLNCAKCHTVKPGEALRGPFLPQVAKTYKREQLAESVLLPSKSIAQGFVTYLFVLDSGKNTDRLRHQRRQRRDHRSRRRRPRDQAARRGNRGAQEAGDFGHARGAGERPDRRRVRGLDFLCRIAGRAREQVMGGVAAAIRPASERRRDDRTTIARPAPLATYW